MTGSHNCRARGGALEQAIATVERWRSFDPLNEDVSLRLMQLQLASGNRVEALKTYGSTEEVLREELSAKPSPKLVALAEFIRNAPAQRGGLHRKQRGPRSSSSRSLLAVPFVGREKEIGLLMSLYEKASRGQPQVVVIEGEAGIGKSRLAATFLDWARAQGADVLAGRAFHSHQHLAYQPLVEPLRERLAREPDLRLLLSGTWLAELVRLLPDLRERYPDLPPASVDEAFEASRLLEALARLDQALAGRATLLVFIDDLQWTDRATLDVFQYLGMQWAKRSTPVMVLLNRRVETRSAGPWLNEWLARLKSDLPVTRLELGPLSAKDTLQIARSVSGEDGEPDDGQGERSALPSSSLPEQAPGGERGAERLGKWLHNETKGQPFFVRTTLEAMLRHGVLVPRLVKGRGWVFEPQKAALHPEVLGSILPSDVREAIQRRLAQLSPPARELLAAGTVLDHDFTFEALSHVAQLNVQEALTALDEALESLLLHESRRHSEGREVPAYTFAHDKIREVVYVGAGDARRRIYHGRALEVLERSGAFAAELAYNTLTFSVLQIVNLLVLGVVYQALLLPEKARGVYLEALKTSESGSAKRYMAMSASLLCAEAVLREDWKGAASYARQALAARDPHEVIFAEAPRWPETAALLRAGAGEQAAEDLEHFREHFGTNKRCSIVLARAQALLAQSRGESQQAIDYVQSAIAEAKAIGLPGEEWQAETALASLYLACTEYEQAAQALARAASTVEQLAGSIAKEDIRLHFLSQAHSLLSSVREQYS